MNKIFAIALSLSTIFTLATCSGVGGESVRVSFSLQKAHSRGLLPYAADYPCFGLIVTGEGIPSLQPGTGNRFPADHCPYAGAASRFVPLVTTGGSASAKVEALVPPGKNRLVQIVAVEQSGATGCPAGTVAEFLKAGNEGVAPGGFGGMYEVGYKVVDLFADTEIQVPNTYNTATAKNLRNCSQSALTLSPAGAGLKVAREAPVNFKASGGVAPYTFSKSGAGTLDTTTGIYIAPSSDAQTATITVQDSVGNSVATTVSSFAPAAEPWAWYRADYYNGNSSNAALSANWANSTKSASFGPALEFAGTGTATFVPRAPNGFPVVGIEGGKKLAGVLSSLSVGGIHALLVARLANRSQTGSLFCLASTGTCGTGSFIKLMGGAVFSAFAQGTGSSSVTNINSPTEYFLLELAGNLGLTDGISVTLNGVETLGSDSSPDDLIFNLMGATSTLTLGPYSTPLDFAVAEFIVELGATYSNQPSFAAYLKSKYQLP